MPFLKQIIRDKIKNKAIVLVDRDGTLCEEVGYLNDISNLKLLPTVDKGIGLLNKNEIAVIVITNQPVVGHDQLTIPGLKEINLNLASMLEKRGAFVDAIYSCPHHPEAPNPKYKLHCRCRKPNTLLYKHAVEDFGGEKVLGIIGDTTRDIQFGKNTGIKTYLVKTGYKGDDGNFDVTADFVCNNFLDCVKKILKA